MAEKDGTAFALRPYQQKAVTAVENEWEQGHQRTLLVLPTGCHDVHQKVLMADGSIRCVADVQIGDHLMGDDGKPRTVLVIYKGSAQMYEIVPNKGEPFVVTESHVMPFIESPAKAKDRENPRVFELSIKEYLQQSNYQKSRLKLMRSQLIEEFERTTEQTITPYFLGILLGDGGLTNSINITTMDSEVVREIRKQAIAYSMKIRIAPTGKANTYTMHGGGQVGHKKVLRTVLEELGLYGKGAGEKFIPDNYKFASADVRLQVLAGLMDTDGYQTKGGYDYITKSHQLADDIVFIARSLGLAAYSKACQKGCKSYNFTAEYYRVYISGDCTIIPCKVNHKKAETRKQSKDVLRTGFTVRDAGIRNYIGFTVDENNRYLLDDFTISKNSGKTRIFSDIARDQVAKGDRVLILAHRDELLSQAQDKLHKFTGLGSAKEKAESTSLTPPECWYRVVVGSVQTLQRDKRLDKFSEDYFDTIIVDEAHHILADGYQKVLGHFPKAKVLGVTATADRGDKKNLGQYFDTLAYEYTLPEAIRDGYLVPIKALTIPLQLDISKVGTQNGDYKTGDLGNALEPYLDQIAAEISEQCKARKTVIFLPLVKTAKKMRDILIAHGMDAVEVNGETPPEERKAILENFEKSEHQVLCNAMLLTEGWDCPSVDCVIMLRPTQIRGLYTQVVGRGLRPSPGKKDLLILDFLWMTERHSLCRPAHLIAKSDDIAEKITKRIEESGDALDIIEAEEKAEKDAVKEREDKLAKELESMKHRKRALVDPLQFELSIQSEDLANYEPSFGWEMNPPSEKQLAALEKMGIFPDEVDCMGKAARILDKLSARRAAGLTTPKQIRFLESRGFKHVGTWKFDTASRMINRIAANNWQIPSDIIPPHYVPQELQTEDEIAKGRELSW